MLGAGVVATVVKNDKTISTAQPKPAITASSVETPTAEPTTSLKASQQVPAPTNTHKKSLADEMAIGPNLPLTGVGRDPAGFVFVVLAGALAVWLRRAARA